MCVYISRVDIYFCCGEKYWSQDFFFIQVCVNSLKERIFETMPCSAVTLSLATITAIVAVALLAIAFSTDNWMYVEVKRAQIHQVRLDVTLTLLILIYETFTTFWLYNLILTHISI